MVENEGGTATRSAMEDRVPSKGEVEPVQVRHLPIYA